MTAISTTSEILASVLTLAEIKDGVYKIANKYAVRPVDTTAKLKDWCNRNLKILPSDFNLRARKTWENLKTLVERYDYQQEQEKRQDAALEEWNELEEGDTLSDEQQEELSNWQAKALAAAAIADLEGADLEGADEFYPVRILTSKAGNVWIAYAEAVTSDWVVSHFALDGEVWTEYPSLEELADRIEFLTSEPLDLILPACSLPEVDAVDTVEDEAIAWLVDVAAPNALQLARMERRAAIGRNSAAALNRRLAKFGL